MNKVLTYMFFLILALILVAYYKGTSNVLGTFGSQVRSLVLYLQGRNNSGNFANYPK